MNKDKDIIYIDTEDDITTIIGKVKASKDKIIALVPPKRTGILQSAVNLRLLQKAAKAGDKKIAIITNNQALTSLAATAKIPVAKNLQTEPELAAIDAIELDDGDDIIDGSDLPIEDLVKVTDRSSDDKIDNGDLKGLNIDSDASNKRSPDDQVYAPKKNDGKKKVKVPDSAKFRKRLLIGIFAGIFLVALLVWAIVFAPAATVIIKAKTDSVSVRVPLSLSTNATNIDSNTIKAINKTTTKSLSVDITPTGTKQVGTAATGTLSLYNSGDTNDTITISAGTTFTRNGLSFVTNKQVTVPGSTVKNNTITPGQATVDITAAAVGSAYNLSSGDYNSPISVISATGTATTGGDSHTAKIVTDSDVTTAKNSLDSQYKDSMKSTLKGQFSSDQVIIDSSYSVDYGGLTANPSVGSEVTSSAKLSGTATYSMTGVAKSDLDDCLKNAIKSQMDTDKQQIYDDGVGQVSFSNYSTGGVTISTTGQIGPKIDDSAIKQEVKGKNYGDAQSIIEKINGVSSADIKFSFFWVNTIPNDTNKIKIEFNIEK